MKTLIVVPNDPLQSYEDAGYPDLTEYFNPKLYFDRVICYSPWEIANAYKTKKYGMEIVPTFKHDKKTSYLSKPAQYVIEKYKPIAIRCYDLRAAAAIGIYEKLPVPVIISVHDTNYQRIPEKMPYADKWITKSYAVKSFLENLKIDNNKISVIPNGIDLNIFKSQKETFNSSIISQFIGRQKIVLCVGRWSKQKNQTTLLQAMKFLPEEYQCIFIGHGIPDHIKHQSFYSQENVKNKHLPKLYSTCSCMCVPSLWEGFGIVFVEAMACEAIVITSDLAPMNEYIVDGVNGFLVKNPLNPEELSDTIALACNLHGNQKHAIGKAARESIKQFSKEFVMEQELELYEKIINH